MNDNKVISLKSRKPLQEEIEEKKRTADETREANLKTHLEAIDNMRRLVADGKLEGILLVGRHPESGLFYYDAAFPFRGELQGVTPTEALAWSGFLDGIQREFADLASWIPVIAPDGSILTPEPIEEEY